MSPVLLGSSFSDFYHAISCQWLKSNKNITTSTTLIFIIIFFRLPWRSWNVNSCFCNQLLWGFLHADNRILWVIWLFIDIQNLFHICNKAAVMFGWNYPSFFFALV